MQIVKIQNSGFNNLNSPRQKSENILPKTTPSNAPEKSTKTSTGTMLIPTQHTEYKRVTGFKQRSNSMFLTQYIGQLSSKRRRSHIGNRSGLQAKTSYENSNNILESSNNNRLNKII